MLGTMFAIFSQYKATLGLYPHLYSLTILVTFFIVAKAVVYIFEHVFSKIAAKTKTEIDDLIFNRIKGPISMIVILIGLRLAVFPLQLGETLTLYVSRGLSTLTVLVATLIVVAVFDILIDNWAKFWMARRKTKVDVQVVRLFHRLSRIFIGVIGLMFVMNIWGIQTAPLLASFGVAGIAIAFAMQSTLGNVFGGMSLIIDRTLKVGDVIELDANTVGSVVDIGFRSTKIKTFDNETIIVPNGKLADSKIKNYAPPDPSARLVLPFGVAYGSKIDQVKKVVLESLKGIKGIKKDPKPYTRFLEMGDSSLKFKVYIWVEHYSERFSVKDKANTSIYNALNKARISIPFPQMDVHLKKQ